MTYKEKLDFCLDDGTECQIAIQSYSKVDGNSSTWDSDMDYYGYEEFEYDLLDMDGKLLKYEPTENEVEQIEEAIRDNCKDDDYDY